MKLYDHQKRALKYLDKAYACLIWSTMGSGKTRIVCEHIGESEQVLIVAPLCVIPVWEKELKKWDVKSFVSVKEKAGGIVVVNYEAVWRGDFGKWVARQEWDLVVLDECQKIKSTGSKVSKFCGGLGRIAKKRVCLSGTPIPNGPLDAFGIYRFLDPGLFCQSYQRFEQKYTTFVAKPNYNITTGYRNQDDFKNCFDFLCCRLDAKLDLPPISFSDLCVKMPSEARQFYDEFEKEFVAYLGDEAMSVPNILVKLLRLQGLTSGVVKLDDGKTRVLHESKAEALRELLGGVDEPVVVFCRFKHDLSECARICRALGRSYCEISGSRKELADWSDVLGVQIQSGGVGIDLTKASIAIFMSTGYSNADYEQAVARLYRPPQDKPVRIVNIHCAETIDGKIAQVLRNKKDLIEGLRKS